MSSSLLTHLFTWSAQVLVLTAAGALAALTLADSKARLLFWQGLLLALLLLPAIEPWQSSPMLVVAHESAAASVEPVTPEVAQLGIHWNWLWLFAAGAALRMVWIAAGFLRLRAYRKRATRLTAPPFRFISPSTSWYVSDAIPGPVTYGWRRPSILLPARVMQLPASQLEAIACHELVHVRRRDWLFVLLEEVVRSLLWFHPAVWYALSRIQLAGEQVVDREVVRLTADREGYLEALVEVAAQSLQPLHAPAPLFLRKRHLAVRVATVLKEVSMSKSRIAARLTAALSAMFAAALVTTWFIPFVSHAQTVMDDAGVTVDAGATLLHRAPVRNPGGAGGSVTLEASLNARGEVTDAHVLSGPDDLRKEALSSVLQWHYAPGLSRVQISMRFDPAATAPSPAPGKQVAGVAGGFIASVPGGRSGPRTAVTPDAPSNPKTVAAIEFLGFSPEAERELRSRLPIREGDPFSPDAIRGVGAAARDFDSHAFVDVIEKPNGFDVTLRLEVVGAARAAVPRVQVLPDIYAVGGTVMQANRLKIVTPMYPPLAKNARIQGAVVFHIVLGKDGRVQNAEFVSGHPLLAPAAKDAVMQWVYKPTLLNGQPVEVQTDVTVNFTLMDTPLPQ